MADRYRQEVFNVILAQLLQERGVISAPESIIKSTQWKNRKMPDVIVNFNGLRTAIEGEVNDNNEAKKDALDSTRKRVEEGVAHIGIAIIYPEKLRTLSFNKLKESLSKVELEVAIITESGETDFVMGNVDYLKNALDRAYDQLLKEDIVAQAVAKIDAGIEKFARLIDTDEGVVSRMAEILGIRELPKKESKTVEEED